MKITAEQLRDVCTSLGDDATHWIAPLNAALETIGADTPARAADFVAQWAHESQEFTDLEENLSYSAERLLQVFPTRINAEQAIVLARNPVALGNHVYGGRMGNTEPNDGYFYRGRGLPMVTGHDNYKNCSIAICGDADTLLVNPELLLEPDYAMAAGAWYWSVNDLNRYSDSGDFDGQSDIISIGRKTKTIGDSNGYQHRLKYRRRARPVFGLPAD